MSARDENSEFVKTSAVNIKGGIRNSKNLVDGD